MRDHRSNAERHDAAADALRLALPNLRLAFIEEGELEWSGALLDIIRETERVYEGLKAYAQQARERQ